MNNVIASPAKKRTSVASLTGLLAILVLVLLALVLRQNIFDWIRLRGYEAPTPVAALATDDTMTDYATKVFYVNHPEIDAKQSFASHCSQKAEQTIVLGCYYTGQNGIFVLKVTDQRLDGVEEVTAAHEMLHAAYDRLSSRDREHIDKLLTDYYKHQLTDERIKQTIENYKKTEPDAVVNEMHSVFGTEVGNLPPELESYYQRYFDNRAKVVAYATAYANEFTSRRAQVKQLDAQLETMKAQIDQATAALDAQARQLKQQRDDMNRQRASGDNAGYNQRVPGYNAAVEAYNSKLQSTRQLISEYNSLVEQRNAIALEVQQLAKAISGDTLPGSE
jgi:hypothetical protein